MQTYITSHEFNSTVLLRHVSALEGPPAGRTTDTFWKLNQQNL